MRSIKFITLGAACPIRGRYVLCLSFSICTLAAVFSTFNLGSRGANVHGDHVEVPFELPTRPPCSLKRKGSRVQSLETSTHNKGRGEPEKNKDGTWQQDGGSPRLLSTPQSSVAQSHRGTVVSPVVVLHPGKAGGGSMRHVLAQLLKESRIKLDHIVCHLHPNACKAKLQTTNHVLIPLRDPIDRIVSAFNWRSLLMCTTGDTRKPGKMKATRNPDRFCKVILEQEQEVSKRYHNNLVGLAEASCHPQGRRDIANIEHAKWSLVAWLGGSMRSFHHMLDRGVQFHVPVNEPGFDFPLQIIKALAELPEPMPTIVNQSSHVFVSDKGSESSHSSSKRGLPTALSTKGLHCLRSYLQEDYEAICLLQKATCLHDGTGSPNIPCLRPEIQSMLNRRNFTCPHHGRASLRGKLQLRGKELRGKLKIIDM